MGEVIHFLMSLHIEEAVTLATHRPKTNRWMINHSTHPQPLHMFGVFSQGNCHTQRVHTVNVLRLNKHSTLIMI
jgi:hypothetical protein